MHGEFSEDSLAKSCPKKRLEKDWNSVLFHQVSQLLVYLVLSVRTGSGGGQRWSHSWSWLFTGWAGRDGERVLPLETRSRALFQPHETLLWFFSPRWHVVKQKQNKGCSSSPILVHQNYYYFGSYLCFLLLQKGDNSKYERWRWSENMHFSWCQSSCFLKVHFKKNHFHFFYTKEQKMNAYQIPRFLFLYKLYSLKELNQKIKNKSINPRKKKLSTCEIFPLKIISKNNFRCHQFKISGRRHRRHLRGKILEMKLLKH